MTSFTRRPLISQRVCVYLCGRHAVKHRGEKMLTAGAILATLSLFVSNRRRPRKSKSLRCSTPRDAIIIIVRIFSGRDLNGRAACCWKFTAPCDVKVKSAWRTQYRMIWSNKRIRSDCESVHCDCFQPPLCCCLK
jgi:hypothetical protein